ncbi:MAG: hypothetical protein NT007_10880 [Candidatus Kapabacteria bacterium]|nr:hypothetical protein [Candidatus Kapabacteria bacterium]
MKFADLVERLEPYFDKEMINDIKKQLPQGSDFTIWGWDVGDFSGDGNIDLAFSIKLAAEKKKVMEVYLFVDIENYLTKVGQVPFDYFEMPLEVGVSIRKNACYVTRKRKQYDWLIRGYSFTDGTLVLLDEYQTFPYGRYTRETYRNYQTLRNTEKFIPSSKSKEDFSADYSVIPCYERGRQIFKGYVGEVNPIDIDYVPKGAFYWTGKEDASFSVSANYDNQFIYMTINVKDDKLVSAECDTCISDHADVWFSVGNLSEDRFCKKDKDKIEFNTNADGGVFCISFFPGDFIDRSKTNFTISTTDELEIFQKAATKNIKVISALRNDGYILKCRIPFAVLGFEHSPVDEQNLVELGCTVVLHDFDNQFRPEEETIINSSKFSSLIPASYGVLVLVPPGKWYGEAINIYQDDIMKYLTEYGF